MSLPRGRPWRRLRCGTLARGRQSRCTAVLRRLARAAVTRQLLLLLLLLLQ